MMLLRFRLQRVATAAASAVPAQKKRVGCTSGAAGFGVAGAAAVATAAAAVAAAESSGVEKPGRGGGGESWTSPAAWYTWLSGSSAAADGNKAFATTSGGVPASLGFGVTLYQYEPCPYCNKVRAFLDYSNIPWNAVEVDPLSKPEIKFSEYKKVPIMLVFNESAAEQGSEQEQGDGAAAAAAAGTATGTATLKQANSPSEAIEQLNDSAHIMDELAARLPAAGGVYRKPHEPADPEGRALVQQWRGWVDDCLVHLLVANLYDTWDNALHAFDYLLTYGNFPSTFQQSMSRYSGALAMYGLSHFKLNKKYGITEPRNQIYVAVDDWIAAVGDDAFLGQSTAPTMADLSVFGVLRAVEGYPVFVDLMAHSKLEGWYSRMKEVVGPSSMLSRV